MLYLRAIRPCYMSVLDVRAIRPCRAISPGALLYAKRSIFPKSEKKKHNFPPPPPGGQVQHSTVGTKSKTPSTSPETDR